MIGIVDYGAGNLRSVQNTLDEIGAEYRLIRTAGELRDAAKIVLPGVGHFAQMMRAFDEMRLREALVERITGGVPFLGICLGLQALFSGSEEAPDRAGFGIFPDMVRRFSSEARVPHMGWNEIEPLRRSKLLDGIGPAPYMYFAHSFYAPITEATAATCEYEVSYAAVVDCGNIFGVQFHPEKSGPLGIRIMRNFVALC